MSEIADFFASCPTREQILNYHPSLSVQQYASELLRKSKSGELTSDEEHELDQCVYVELLIRLVKARVRPS